MQLITYKKTSKYFSSRWLTACAVFGLAGAQIAEGVPLVYSKVEKGTGVVTSTYQHSKTFSFSREENDKIIKRVLEKIPLGQAATIISSSKPVKGFELKDEFTGHSQRNIRQLHLVAVSFARTDLLPVMYFQVKEDWLDCDFEGESCNEYVQLDISGPSRLVRDLNDFSSFPRNLNVLQVSLRMANSGPFAGAGASPATAVWTMKANDADAGLDTYVRYFRSKVDKQDETITPKYLRAAMAMWASSTSKSAFSSL